MHISLTPLELRRQERDRARALSPGRVRTAATLLFILAASLFVSCASQPQSRQVEPEAFGVTRTPFPRNPREYLPNTLVMNGYGLSLPAGFRFEPPYGAAQTGEVPSGVIFRFRNGDASFRGSLQRVQALDHLAPQDGAGYTRRTEELARRYASEYLPPGSAWTLKEAENVSALNPAIISRDRESATETVTLLIKSRPHRKGDTYQPTSLILEMSYPVSRLYLRTTAADIAATFRRPDTVAAGTWHAETSTSYQYRGSESPLPLEFTDPAGIWRWTADIPGGVVLERRLPEASLYVAIRALGAAGPASSGSASASGDRAYEQTGEMLRVSRGPWRWEIPVQSLAGADEAAREGFRALVPPNPQTGEGPVEIIYYSPHRSFVPGAGIPTPPPLEKALEEVQSLLEHNIDLQPPPRRGEVAALNMRLEEKE